MLKSKALKEQAMKGEGIREGSQKRNQDKRKPIRLVRTEATGMMVSSRTVRLTFLKKKQRRMRR